MRKEESKALIEEYELANISDNEEEDTSHYSTPDPTKHNGGCGCDKDYDYQKWLLKPDNKTKDSGRLGSLNITTTPTPKN